MKKNIYKKVIEKPVPTRLTKLVRGIGLEMPWPGSSLAHYIGGLGIAA